MKECGMIMQDKCHAKEKGSNSVDKQTTQRKVSIEKTNHCDSPAMAGLGVLCVSFMLKQSRAECNQNIELFDDITHGFAPSIPLKQQHCHHKQHHQHQQQQQQWCDNASDVSQWEEKGDNFFGKEMCCWHLL